MAYEPKLTTLAIVYLAVLALLLVFTIVQFVSMVRSKRISREQKGLWTIAFIVASGLTAIVYWITKPNKFGRR